MKDNFSNFAIPSYYSSGLTANTFNCVEVNDFYRNRDYTTNVSVKIGFVSIYGIIFVFGLAGNTSVIVTIVRNKRRRGDTNPRNIFLLSLMVSDLVLCLSAVPSAVIGAVTKKWLFGRTLCAVIPLCQTMTVIINSFCLTTIAVDKYVHIVEDVKRRLRFYQCLAIVGGIWFSALLMNVPLIISYELFDGSIYLYAEQYKVAFCGQFCEEIGWRSEKDQRMFGTFVMVVQFIIPVCVITFCYTKILKKVGKDMIVENKTFTECLSKAQQKVALGRKRKVNYILIAMVVTFVASWLPITVYNILRDYDQFPSFVENQPYLWFLTVHSVAMTTVLWNPLLFFWLTKPRKKRVKTSLLQNGLTMALLPWKPSRATATQRGLCIETTPLL